MPVQREAIRVSRGILHLLLAASALTPMRALAQDAGSGEKVYKEVCMACHGTKVDKAPQLGDRKAWAPLIREGQAVLTAHGWVGVRGMPPKGGKADLTLEAFARATAYMVRAAGGTWKDPDDKMLARIRAEEKKRLAGGNKAK